MPRGTATRWAVRHGVIRLVRHVRIGREGGVAGILSDPAAIADPYPLYERIRAAGPIARGRFGALTVSHPAASAVLRNETFRTGMGSAPFPPPLRALIARARDPRVLGPLDPPSLLVVDAPEHTRYRRLVAKVFTVRAIEALRPRVEQVAAGLLDDLGRSGTVDLVPRYASLLPVTVIAEVLGVPLSMRRQFLAWGAAASPSLDMGLSYPQFRRAEVAIARLTRWMLGHFARLRREPGDDLLSRLVTLRDDGEELSETELLALANLILVAGFETTVNLLGTGVVLLDRHRDQRALLASRPHLWANAADEILRYEPPVQATGRIAARDTEVLGTPVPAGTVVILLLGGANRDPAVFAEPSAFDVGRPNAREHLAFSAGSHFCLGAALARMEGEIGLRALYERYPDLAVVGAPGRRDTRVLRGYAAVPATLGRPA